MMQLEWKESLSTDVPEIDAQYKKLVRQLNGLSVPMEAGRGPEEISRMLDFLEQYAV